MSLFDFKKEKKVGTVFKADSPIGRRLAARGKSLITKPVSEDNGPLTTSSLNRPSGGFGRSLLGKRVRFDADIADDLEGVVKRQDGDRIGVAVEGQDSLVFVDVSEVEVVE